MTWDEAKHPRVPGGDINGGQFTEKQVDTAAAAATNAAVPVMSPALVERFKDVASRMSTYKIEVAYCYNPETGELLFNKDGEVNEVRFESWQAQEMNNAVLLHNHPSGNSGAMFSNADINTMIKTNARGMAIVAGDKLVMIKRRREGWGDKYPEFIQQRLVTGLSDYIVEKGIAKAGQTVKFSLDVSNTEILDVVVDAYKGPGIDAFWMYWKDL